MTLHIYEVETGFAVWIEPEDEDKFSGLCAGFGDTRKEALIDAAQGLNDLLAQLNTLTHG